MNRATESFLRIDPKVAVVLASILAIPLSASVPSELPSSEEALVSLDTRAERLNLVGDALARSLAH